MCGIAAIITTHLDIPDGAIARMVASLVHRGPDEQAHLALTACRLGHTRLSVIDIVGGHQPMADASQRYWIVFNGEIYNYRELRTALEARGHTFRTQSDTEVLLATYLEYGEGAPAHLNGQFAFAIWDTREQTLFAARDRLGEKPLYWAQLPDGGLLLASSANALLASGMVSPQLDRSAVDAYLALLYVPPERTIYGNIHTLPPGSTLCWQHDRYRIQQYWQPDFTAVEPLSVEDAVGQLRRLIEQAVHRQMVADVPVGAFLSGGLDSSTIVALMTGHTTHAVDTFAVGFGKYINELPYARAVAEAYRTNHHELTVDTIQVGEMLERMAEVYDEPFADSSNIPTYLMAEFARRHVKVVLSGDAGDELFGGYAWYRPLLFRQLHAPEPNWKRALTQGIGFALRLGVKMGLPVLPLRDSILDRCRAERDRDRFADLWEQHINLVTGLLKPRDALWGGNPPENTAETIRQHYYPSDRLQALDRASDFDLRCYLPGDILVKVDRAAMAHGLETRVPFLDVDLITFTLSLPWRLRFSESQSKPLLQAACSNLWPEQIRRRPKQGFGAPVWQWVNRPDVHSLLQRVTAPNSPLVALLPGVPSLLPSLPPQEVWTLLCLGLWLERHPECLNHQ